ncbi:hypothetical protein [Stenotrophomonas maltophilia]|uniref:Uncharacterized protein n=1 Tax=Stenotrophomonas maltophilia TaxID=40324 RepID=A0AAI9G2E6_STEMA|nr:hypothetical protein [Stenotrophomonas maltophilia]EKT4443988.1 hypothetical protein [Stenotrophomonas maltophilia]
MSIQRYEMGRHPYDSDISMIFDDHGNFVRYTDHSAEIARLRAEADALRVDAERYRFLRSGGCGATLRFHNSNPANRDDVVDAAMGADA